MSNRLLYLAEPVDFYRLNETSDVHLVAMRDMVLKLAAMAGWIVYQPTKAWQTSGTPRPIVYEVNMAVLASADVVVALLPAHARTVGVPFEAGYAEGAAIPYAMITNHRTSWMLVPGKHGRGAVFRSDQFDEVKAWMDTVGAQQKVRQEARS